MVRLISNRGGARSGFNAIVLSAALADGEFRSKQRAAAEQVQQAAAALARGHHDTGAYESSIRVRRRNRADLEVVATDPAAAHIEFGHVTKNGTHVQGLHIMRSAALLSGGITSFPARGAGGTGVPD